MSNDYIAKVENIIRSVVPPKDLGMIVSNIGVYPDLSAIYTTNASMDTAFVQTSLKEGHSVGSYEYMRRVQQKLSREMPELSTYFQAADLVDGVINQGLPAPIDIQIGSKQYEWRVRAGQAALPQKIKAMPNVSGVYIPQSVDYPGIQLNIDREKASLIGLSAKDVVDNVITAMTSDGMVAPSYWIDPKTGNNYMVTVQYANRFINNMTMEDFENIPSARRPSGRLSARCRRLARLSSHSQRVWSGRPHLRLYTARLGGGYPDDQYSDGSGSLPDSARDRHLCGDQNRGIAESGSEHRKLVATPRHDKNTVLKVRGAVVSMNSRSKSLASGWSLRC